VRMCACVCVCAWVRERKEREQESKQATAHLRMYQCKIHLNHQRVRCRHDIRRFETSSTTNLNGVWQLGELGGIRIGIGIGIAIAIVIEN